jgi:hypothetical protein
MHLTQHPTGFVRTLLVFFPAGFFPCWFCRHTKVMSVLLSCTDGWAGSNLVCVCGRYPMVITQCNWAECTFTVLVTDWVARI